MKSKRVNSETLREVHNRVGKVSLLKDLSGEDDVVAQGDLKTEVTDLITDSRRVTPGSAFFAIPGQRANGNDFLEQQIDSYSGNKQKALIDFCGAVMSANEFIYIE